MQAQRPSVKPLIPLFVLLVLRAIVAGGISLPSVPDWFPSPVPAKATSVAYIYEKDDTNPPAAVMSALNRINREKKILATLFEDDVVDGTGETPDQYKIPLAEANKAGLPALVVMSGETVLKVVKAPTTEEQILEAVP